MAITAGELIKMLQKVGKDAIVWAFDGDGYPMHVRGLGLDPDGDCNIITDTEKDYDYEKVIELPDIDDDRVW